MEQSASVLGASLDLTSCEIELGSQSCIRFEPCIIGKTDGSSEAGIFPREVSPHQPFLRVRSICHEVTPRPKAEVELEGEVFEMEDHRDWGDGSFKTYCAPMSVSVSGGNQTGNEAGPSDFARSQGQYLEG